MDNYISELSQLKKFLYDRREVDYIISVVPTLDKLKKLLDLREGNMGKDVDFYDFDYGVASFTLRHDKKTDKISLNDCYDIHSEEKGVDDIVMGLNKAQIIKLIKELTERKEELSKKYLSRYKEYVEAVLNDKRGEVFQMRNFMVDIKDELDVREEFDLRDLIRNTKLELK